tara:strand:+ start:5493 stop:5912 length:420 start_codon:yes stop_codon:yes gene_type:complete
MVKKRKFILRTSTVATSAIECIHGLELNEDKPLWQVIIEPYKKARSNKQNRLYWDWMTIVSAETGYTKLEAHEAFRDKFKDAYGLEKTGSLGGHDFTIRVSTKTLEPSVFAQYMQDIERFCMDTLNLYLPHPEDQHHGS